MRSKYAGAKTIVANMERQRAVGRKIGDLWKPQPGPQTIAYECQADVIGFGGAAGGGKSSLALGFAITRHRRSLILRREATQLRGIIDHAAELLGTRGKMNENLGIWRLPGRQQIEFGGCKDQHDEQKYRGRPHDFICFDEADAFTLHQVKFISAWLRTTDARQRCRLLITFNPPQGSNGEWLIDYFAPWLREDHPRPAAPAELRWFAQVDGAEIECESGEPFEHDGETIKPQSRTFIPAKLQDNKYITADYVRQLQSLPEPLRSQLLYGDFRIGKSDDAFQVIPTEWVKAAQKRWTEKPPDGWALSAVGVDVARGGRDNTTIAPRRKSWYGRVVKHAGSETPDGDTVIDQVERVLMGEAAIVNLDVIGVGAAAFDAGKRRKLKMHAVDFREGTNARDRTGRLEFRNFRAWAYWHFRDLLDPASGENIMLPPDRELLVDLTAPRWRDTAQGIVIEDKDDIKKRIGRSPDVADAVVNASLSSTSGRIGMASDYAGGRTIVDAAPKGVFGTGSLDTMTSMRW